MPAPWMRGEHRGVDQRVVRDDGDAAERLRLVEPAGAQRVEQQRARQLRRGLARALQARPAGTS